MIPEIRENELLNHLAEKYGVSLAQIILRWHIERGLVPVVKTSSEKRVKENTDIFLLHFRRRTEMRLLVWTAILRSFLSQDAVQGIKGIR